MANSQQVDGLVGPSLVAMLVSESPRVQPKLYDAQIPPVIDLPGVRMFVAGLALVRAHKVWARNWTVLITLSAWFFLALGYVRRFATVRYGHAPYGASSMSFMALEGMLSGVALTIVFKACGGSTT